MKIDTQDYLRLVEQAKTIVSWDIEATGLKGDYNSILVVSIKPHGMPAYSFHVTKPGDDRKVCLAVKKELEKYDCWVTYYGKGFDIKMLNTRLLKHGIDPVDPKPHIDMYFALKSKLLTGRKSQAHLLEWLETPQKKMSVSADEWVRILHSPKKEMPIMVARCESDCEGLEALYDRTKHLIRDIRR